MTRVRWLGRGRPLRPAALAGALVLAVRGAPPDKGITSPHHPRVTAPAPPATRLRTPGLALDAPGTLRTDTLWSASLGTRKRLRVWLPASYEHQPGRRYPVAIFLHGAYGAEDDWVRAGHLDHTLDSLVAAGTPEMIVVMPDGDDGFYTTWNTLPDAAACRRRLASRTSPEPADTYCVPWPHYDDYIARDLVHFIDARYRTRADAGHRGIAGLSMGGYGAVALALAYPDAFGAAASLSGVLAPMVGTGAAVRDDPRYAPDLATLRTRWADGLWDLLEPVFGRDTTAWLARDPARLAARLLAAHRPVPALHLDCGTDDFLLPENRFFHRELQRLGIPVAYAEYPGAHTWEYWRTHSAESVTWLARRLSDS